MNKKYTLNDVEIQKKGLKSFNYWAMIAVLPSQKKLQQSHQLRQFSIKNLS